MRGLLRRALFVPRPRRTSLRSPTRSVVSVVCVAALLCAMASITEFDDGRAGLVGDPSAVGAVKAALIEVLRTCDDAVLLPGASHSPDTFTFKNTVMTLDGQERDVPYRAFHSDWGHGISVIRVPADAAERVLQPHRREATLKALASCCRNALNAEEAGSDVVGPSLGADESRDDPGDVWHCGFDGANCAVGLYSANEHTVPKGGTVGMTRVARSYFLAAKAGAGQAGQELSARLMSAAADGLPLDAIVADAPGAAPGHIKDRVTITTGQLRRVYAAGRRNRARILLAAAEKLGLSPDVESVPDHACCEEDSGVQTAVLLADSVTNVLDKVQSPPGCEDGSRWRYYAGAVAPAYSQGVISCSNVSEGMTLFLDPVNDSAPVRITNQAHGSVPFGSRRVMRTFEALRIASDAHRSTRANALKDVSDVGDAGGASGGIEATGQGAHPDGTWIRSHFAWKPPKTSRRTSDAARAVAASIEPPQLWGTHAPLNHAQWSHALGLGGLRDVQLSPEAVALSGAEPDAYRAVLGTILAA